MAKKSVTKSAKTKKASAKSSKTKPPEAKKKTRKSTAVKKTTNSAASKKAAKKTLASKSDNSKKTKSTKKRTERTTHMNKKTTKKKEETTEVKSETMSAAETRAKALEKIKGYSKKDLEHFREIILAKRDEIIDQLQNLKEQMLDPTTGEYINENSPYSLHMAEQGTDAMEREKTFLYAQRENKFLGYLEDALKRIDAGTYGICIECIENPHHLCETCPLIPKARLEAVPHSQLCLPIKQKQEKR